MTVWEQIKSVLRSRKFWVLLAAIAGIAAGFVSGEIDAWQAVQALIAAGGVYSLGIAVEDAGMKSGG